MKTHNLTRQLNRRSRKISSAFLIAIALPALSATAFAQATMTVAWSPNPEADVAGYKVHIGTSSGVYSSSQDVSKKTAVVFSGLTASATYYCAVQAYDSAGLASGFSPELRFTTPPPVTFFGTWAAASGLSGDSAFAGSAPATDGVPNLLKYAFNLNPAEPDRRVLEKGAGTAGLPVFSIDQSGSQRWFSVEFLRRKGSELTYVPKVSTDLVTFRPMIGTTIVSQIDEHWERAILRMAVAIASTPTLFGRLDVSLP